MRHKNRKLQLNRFTSWRQATIKSLVRSLLLHESMRTISHRAKIIRPLAEHLVTLAKANTLSAKREAFRILGDHKLVSMLFNEIGPRFAKRVSGYTRIINLSRRRGDDAQMVIFELTERKPKLKKIKKDKDVKPEEQIKDTKAGLKVAEEKKPEAHEVTVKERHPVTKKPTSKFLGGIRKIFKKERDSL